MENGTNILACLGVDLKLSSSFQLTEHCRNLPPCMSLAVIITLGAPGDCCCFHCNPSLEIERGNLSKVEENGKHLQFPFRFLPRTQWFYGHWSTNGPSEELQPVLKTVSVSPTAFCKTGPVPFTLIFQSASNNPTALPSFECVGSYFFMIAVPIIFFSPASWYCLLGPCFLDIFNF